MKIQIIKSSTISLLQFYLKDYNKNYFHDHDENKVFVKVVKPFFSQRQLCGGRLSKCLKI